MSELKRIRVLLTVPHLRSTSSPYRQVIGIARYLPRDEFDLTICSLLTAASDVDSELQALGVTWLKAPFRPKGRTLRHVWYSLRNISYIRQFGPFDIQHSFDYTSWPFESLIATFRRVPIVIHQKNLNQEGKTLLFKIKLLTSSRIIAVSDTVKEYVMKHGIRASKVHRIYNGIDLDNVPFGLDNHVDEDIILLVGHIGPGRRYEDAIRALSRLKSEMPTLQLKIVGQSFDETYYSELQALVQELALQDQVTFFGRSDSVIELMRQSKVLLMTTLTTAFSWSTAEAMSVGLPVVTSASGGPEELIVDGICGYVVPVGDVDGYVNALRQILSNPDLAADFAKRARERVEQRFTVEKMVEGIANVYREIASR